MTSKPIDVAIIGGGMCGLVAAIGCLKHPHLNVQVYEAAHHFGEIGAGVAIGPNAQRALKLVGQSTYQAYLNQETNNLTEEHSNVWFEYRRAMGEPQEEFLVSLKNETGQSTVHRAKFLDEFVKLLPTDRAHFGKRLDGLKELGNGRIVMHFADDSTAEADCVLGADGIHGVVRRYVLPEGDPHLHPQFTGSVMYRSLIPMDVAVAAVGEKYAKNSFFWCGYDGLIITFPIDHGEKVNVAAMKNGFDKWEGPWVRPVAHDEIKEAFAHWGEHARQLVHLLEKDGTQAWSVWDFPEASTYCKGNILMMGDAAHAGTPWQGSGAGQAIEDAYVIQALLYHAQSPKDLSNLFRAFDRIRRPRASRVVSTSREMGKIGTFSHPEIGDDKKKFQENVQWRMDWIWHRDVEGEVNEAKITFDRLQSGHSID